MKITYFLIAFAMLICQVFGISCDDALQKLVQGNKRYCTDTLEHPRRDSERRESLVASQTPFAIVVSCSDSRVSPEIIFDQGIGDLFVVRVAGNVIGDIELDSINYAAKYLGCSLVLVLGHENCGAVKDTLTDQMAGIQAIYKLIEPAALQAKKKHTPPLLEDAIHFNVDNMVNYLEKTPILSELVAKKKLCILGGYYNLDSGKVDITLASGK